MDLGTILANMVLELKRIRTTQGEEAWRVACHTYARSCLKAGPQGERFAKTAFEGVVDLDALRREIQAEKRVDHNPKSAEAPQVRVVATPAPETAPAPEATPGELASSFVAVLRSQMPGMRTQAQYDALMVAGQALTDVAGAIFDGDMTRAGEGRKALLQALDAMTQATSISNQLRDVPEAATSKAAEAFKQPPAQFVEQPAFEALLADMAKATTVDALDVWYQASKDDRAKIITPTLRNKLYDAVREKKLGFAS